MSHKLIKLSDTHYIVVDDSDIYLHDYFLAGKEIQQCMTSSEVDDLSIDDYAKKITHSTQPLEGGIVIHGVEHKQYIQIKYLDLSEVEEVINGYTFDSHTFIKDEFGFSDEQMVEYEKSLSENSFAELDKNSPKCTSDFTKTLPPKTEWNIQFINNKITLI